MQNNLSELIRRSELLVKQNIVSNFSILNEEQHDIAQALGVCLPSDFIKINANVSYIGFSNMEFSMIYVERNYIIEDNQRIRTRYAKQSQDRSDMTHILVLADDDGGSVFMITQDSPEKPTPVMWCDYGDMYYYSIHKKFQYSHDEWPSFAAFFEYLVEQEEKKLEESGE